MATSIILLHVLTGCDLNSGFYGASKKLIADLLENSKEAHNFLEACRTQFPVTQEVISDLICIIMIPKTIPFKKWERWSGELRRRKHTMWFWPDLDSIHPNLEHAYLQKHNILQRYPSPSGHAWHLVTGLFLPIHSIQASLPPSICLHTNPEAVNNGDDSNESNVMTVIVKAVVCTISHIMIVKIDIHVQLLCSLECVVLHFQIYTWMHIKQTCSITNINMLFRISSVTF